MTSVPLLEALPSSGTQPPGTQPLVTPSSGTSLGTTPPPRLFAAMCAVALWTFAMALPAIGARATYGARTTADEPQYLTTAISIAEDFDLDISDELADRRFEPYHEISLNTQTIDLDESGRRISPHDPLLPVLLALPMRLGGWVAAKAFLAISGAAAAAATVWLAVRRFSVPVGVAGIVAAAFFAAPPLTSYSTQVYPEMPAALCFMLGLAAITGALTVRGRALVVLSVIALPWLSVKYVPVAVALTVAAATRLWRRNRRHFVTDMMLLAAAAAVYIAFHRGVYGGWTAYASGDHFVASELLVLGSDPDYLGRSRRLLGLIIDRGFGLAAWTPAYLLAVPAAAAFARRRPPGWGVSLAAFAVGYCTAVWLPLTMHGWWWPGRQLVVVLPVAVAAVALLAACSRLLLWASVVGCAVGVFNWLWLTAEVYAGHRTLIVDFEQTTNPIYRAWSTLLADHSQFDMNAMAITAVWSAILAAVFGWSWARSRLTVVQPPVVQPPVASLSDSHQRRRRREVEPVFSSQYVAATPRGPDANPTAP